MVVTIVLNCTIQYPGCIASDCSGCTQLYIQYIIIILSWLHTALPESLQKYIWLACWLYVDSYKAAKLVIPIVCRDDRFSKMQ